MAGARKRFLLSILGILFVIFFGISAMLQFFPPDKIRRETENQISKALEHPVKIGKLKIQLFPRVGATLSSIQIGNEPTSGKLFAQIDALDVGISFLPLFQKNLQITHLSIIKPSVTIVQQEKTSPDKEVRPGKKSTEKPKGGFAATFKKVSIQNGTLDVLSPTKKPVLHLGGINETLSASASAKGEYLLEGLLEIARIHVHLPGGILGQGIQLRLNKRLSYKEKEDTLSIERADLQLGDLPLTLTGKVSRLKTTEPHLIIQMSGGPANVKSIMGYLPSSIFPEMEGISSEGVLAIQLAANGTQKKLDYNASLKLTDGKLTHPLLPTPVKDIAFELSATPTRLDLHTFQAKTEKSRLSLSGHVNDYKETPTVDLTAKVNFDLKEVSALQPNLKDVAVQGRAVAQFAVKGKAKDPEKLTYNGNVTLKNITVRHPKLAYPLKGVNGSATITNNVISISKIHGNLGSSTFDIKGKVRNYLSQPLVSLSLRSNLHLAEIASLQTTPKSTRITGTANVSAQVDGPIKKPEQLRFGGTVTLSNASYSDSKSELPPVKKIRGTIQLKQQKFALKNISGRLGRSDFSITGGIRDIRPLYIEKHKNNKIIFDVAMKNAFLDLDELAPNQDKKESTNLKSSLAVLDKLEGRINLTAKKVRFNKNNATHVKGVAHLKNRRFELKKFSFNTFGGSIKLSGHLDYTNEAKPAFDLDLKVEQVKVKSLLGYANQLDRFGKLGRYLDGSLSTKTKFKGNLNESMQLDISRLYSKGNIRINQAKLSGHPMQSKLSAFLKAPQLNNISIKQWFAPFEIKNGKLDIKNLKLSAKGFDVKGSGWQSVDGRIQMALDLSLPPHLSKGIRNRVPKRASQLLFGDPNSRILVPLSLSGLVTSPTVTLDQRRFAAGIKSRMNAKLKQQKTKFQQDLRKKTKNALQDLFKKN